MGGRRNLFGMSAEARARLVARLAAAAPGGEGSQAARLEVSRLDGYRDIEMLREAGEYLGIPDPFFRVHDGIAGAETVIDGRRYVNFASYDYLGLNGDERISGAAKAAIDRYGTTVSASRAVSGERGVHRALEEALARLYGCEDSLVMVGGHATNVTTIGCLFGRDDVVVHDALIHNSILEGARLSGARRLAFPHLDHEAADRLLGAARRRGGKALLALEGHYSMDGDVPDLGAFLAVARRHRASLLVDEAHALGVIGTRGCGSAERCGIDPGEVDIWMGTLSKSLVSCGGYIAGRGELIGYLKRAAPGFVYSVGIAPAAAAAALAALEVLQAEPLRVRRVNERASLFLRLARDAGLDVGGSVGAAIVPVITGSSIAAARLAEALFRRGINVQPIIYPAVPERAARLRFFLTAAHGEGQIREAVRALAEESRRISVEPSDIAALARRLGKPMPGQ
ncbi:MAG TPA: aminotransferase class I/II-fold pyridoxal phosphate-dependent enzyme [Stellaceae bacterium]|nr:aminotransferase class I/II-fold pyridoxal phosphate-dependent enzyme [Stellaceae bacterium]